MFLLPEVGDRLATLEISESPFWKQRHFQNWDDVLPNAQQIHGQRFLFIIPFVGKIMYIH